MRVLVPEQAEAVETAIAFLRGATLGDQPVGIRIRAVVRCTRGGRKCSDVAGVRAFAVRTMDGWREIERTVQGRWVPLLLVLGQEKGHRPYPSRDKGLDDDQWAAILDVATAPPSFPMWCRRCGSVGPNPTTQGLLDAVWGSKPGRPGIVRVERHTAV